METDMEQQQQLLLQQQQSLLLQQLTKQAQQQQATITRFPSNIDAHLRPPPIHRPLTLHQKNPSPSHVPVPIPNLQQQQGSDLGKNAQHSQQQQKGVQGNQVELQMAYQDAWHVCHPDFKRPFSSLEDACERDYLYAYRREKLMEVAMWCFGPDD
ncbi:hypothetical protein OIU84_017577 [Salix udensis]|uniref:Uncharacterized protein n=1 Tax=Salix udensis TaxID=889485 RepID=A0AAD6L2B9_9ROSI|nr:hypothetical protein OIU84_017577 [Salix udensis]